MSASDPTPSRSEDQEQPGTPPGSLAFPVVGVGASAGGLEAFSELLAALPPNPGLAFLFVQHLEPHRKSELSAILSRVTTLPVQEVTEGMPVEVNQVFLLPPNTNMALTDGSLTLIPRSLVPGQHMPVDYLFRSLAALHKDRAIGVLLSGGGTDGTLGCQAIKAEGGITFCQDEKTARHPSMPRAAVLDGSADYVLTPTEIAKHLARLAQHPYTQPPPTPPAPSPLGADEAIREIIALVRVSTSVDFSQYKQTTIKRRILRRMALRGLEKIKDYLKVLQEDPVELHRLYNDFLIRVTQFFRDPEAFEALKEKVFPAMLKGRARTDPIRIWVAGCSTGEEVYSIAILLLEYLEQLHETLPVKILATDLNEEGLDKARSGVFIDNIEVDVAPDRLRRYFVRMDGHYQISKAVRELCVFSRHNMITDPPFSHLDLVSCRNVLIYMNSTLQKRVLPTLHYALNPEGFLFLGSSENIGTFTDLFNVVDPRYRIFSKRPGSTCLPLELGRGGTYEERLRQADHEAATAIWSALDVLKEADRIVLARYAPVGVVVDESANVIQFRGRTAAYLEPAPGMASLDLFRMLREGLLAEVRSAFTQAKAENNVVTRDSVHLADGGPHQVRLEVIPFKVPPAGVRFFLVLFQEVTPGEQPKPAAPQEPRVTATEQQVLQLQQELAALREYLQSVIEEQESTNEELKSANEEILSANEELQSTNEELQTAKEEAQSTNEELATVNEELRHRNVELARVNNDLVNLLSGVGIPIVMVGRDLRIRRFTPLAEQVFNLIPTDVGRPLSDIKSNLNIGDLVHLLTQVIDTLTPHESEVQDTRGRRYLLRIRPYVTLENKIDGASVVLVDVESIRQAAERSKQKDDGSNNP